MERKWPVVFLVLHQTHDVPAVTRPRHSEYVARGAERSNVLLRRKIVREVTGSEITALFDHQIESVRGKRFTERYFEEAIRSVI
jgi:hypothetical protein